MLRIDNLRKRYRTGDEALKDVSFTVPSGQLVGLIGPSGAGKSTLIRCVNRLIEPTRGRIFLDDLELTALSRADLRKARRRIGMIFQEFALVERLTVMENVLSGRLGYVPFWRSFSRRYTPADVEKAFVLLERVGVLDQADKRADALSGGQRQRVGVARALEQDPELLLIDEPTASLDPKTSRQIMRLIREICAERNLPAVINLHDVLLAQAFVDRIIGLRDGAVVFDGPPSALSHDALTRIYGEEDWMALQRRPDRENEANLSGADRETVDGEIERRASLA
jgi:phosphonate transport system ATP-binding protein